MRPHLVQPTWLERCPTRRSSNFFFHSGALGFSSPSPPLLTFGLRRENSCPAVPSFVRVAPRRARAGARFGLVGYDYCNTGADDDDDGRGGGGSGGSSRVGSWVQGCWVVEEVPRNKFISLIGAPGTGLVTPSPLFLVSRQSSVIRRPMG